MLGMLYQLFRLTQQSGVMALEAHFEDPQEPRSSRAIPKFLATTTRSTSSPTRCKVIIVGGIARTISKR